jgi:hypothetical protein
MTGTQRDVLLRLQRWRTRLERSSTTDRETCQRRITVSRAAAEIERLRARVEELEAERARLEAVVTSPARGGSHDECVAARGKWGLERYRNHQSPP